jgi:hypothetical protein
MGAIALLASPQLFVLSFLLESGHLKATTAGWLE